MTSANRSLSIIVLAAIVAAVPLGAQTPLVAPTPPAPQAAGIAALIERAPLSPPPATVRPSSIPAAQQRPTPAVVLPPSPGSPSPESARAPGGAALVARSAEVAPTPLAAPVPPPPSAGGQGTALPVLNAPGPPPAGATGRCKDGTYLTGAATEAQCGARGGLAATFSAPRRAPTRPQ